VRTSPGDDVLATGRLRSNRLISPTRRERVFSAASVRDAMVAVGRFRTHRRTVNGTPLTVGSAPSVGDDPAAVAEVIAGAMSAHAGRFGPFPYADLTVVVLPRLSGGIEFPGAIMLGTGEYLDETGSHEVGHEYFYGLVGNDQARDPWLDESFATYAEALHHGTAGRYTSAVIPVVARGRVGRPMTFWESHQTAYFRGVYVQGAAALLRARAASGAAAFDAAIRCYVRRQAHTIARPADLAAALSALPAARQMLVAAGALP
jgi:aminopeptidase N